MHPPFKRTSQADQKLRPESRVKSQGLKTGRDKANGAGKCVNGQDSGGRRACGFGVHGSSQYDCQGSCIPFQVSLHDSRLRVFAFPCQVNFEDSRIRVLAFPLSNEFGGFTD